MFKSFLREVPNVNRGNKKNEYFDNSYYNIIYRELKILNEKAKTGNISTVMESLKKVNIDKRAISNSNYIILKGLLDLGFAILKSRIEYNQNKKNREKKENYKEFKSKIRDMEREIKYNENIPYIREKLKDIKAEGIAFESCDYLEIKRDINNLWDTFKIKEQNSKRKTKPIRETYDYPLKKIAIKPENKKGVIIIDFANIYFSIFDKKKQPKKNEIEEFLFNLKSIINIFQNSYKNCKTEFEKPRLVFCNKTFPQPNLIEVMDDIGFKTILRSKKDTDDNITEEIKEKLDDNYKVYLVSGDRDFNTKLSVIYGNKLDEIYRNKKLNIFHLEGIFNTSSTYKKDKNINVIYLDKELGNSTIFKNIYQEWYNCKKIHIGGGRVLWR